MRNETVIITGAFSYTGKYATRLLLEHGYRVRTLTFHPGRDNEFGPKVEAFPYHFEHPEQLERTLRGSACLVNTYWVRFPQGHSTFDTAVRNTMPLIKAAKNAGVRHIVHVSMRSTVIFGREDILINNIAWFVRNFPLFGIPGDGCYGVRPIFVEDMAKLIVGAVETQTNQVADVVGPETFTFEELVRLIAAQIGKQVRVIHLPTVLAYLSTSLVGAFLRDVVLTWEEYKGLMSNLLAPQGPGTGQTRLSQWLAQNREQLGRHYASEVARHYR